MGADSAGVVLLTGSSSGIGRVTAGLLAGSGFRVFGADLRPDPAPPAGVAALPLDVCDDAAVTRCVAAVHEQAGRVDALVCCAGYALAGALEECSLEEARAQLETNFFGVARLVNAVLPGMRERGQGRIVSVSSGAAVTAQPFAGYYTASKTALEGYSEALRHEVRPFGVHVTLIEPGCFRTNVARNAHRAARPLEAYGPWRERAIRAAERYTEAAPAPDAVARCVLRALRSRAPRLRYRVGRDVTTSFWVRKVMPYSWFEPFVRKHYDLDRE